MKILLSALILAFSVSGASAASYKIDAAHSAVSFKIRHFVSKIQGSFNDFSGTFTFDPKKVKKSKLDITINAASIDTGNAKRDGHLRRKDFFHVKKYPVITFKSKKVRPAGKGHFFIDGILAMHGKKKKVTLDVDFGGEVVDGKGRTHAGFSATTKIDRTDFDIVYNKTLETGGLLLGEDIAISIEIEAIRED